MADSVCHLHHFFSVTLETVFNRFSQTHNLSRLLISCYMRIHRYLNIADFSGPMIMSSDITEFILAASIAYAYIVAKQSAL